MKLKKIKQLAALAGSLSAAPANFRGVQRIGNFRFLESDQRPLTHLQISRGITPTMSIDPETGNMFFQYAAEGAISFQRIAAKKGSMTFSITDAAKEFLQVITIVHIVNGEGYEESSETPRDFRSMFTDMQIEVSLTGIVLCLYENGGSALRFNYELENGAFKAEDGRLMTVKPIIFADIRIICIATCTSMPSFYAERAPYVNRAHQQLLHDLGLFHCLSPMKPLAKDLLLKIRKDRQEIILPSELTEKIKAFWPVDSAPFANALLNIRKDRQEIILPSELTEKIKASWPVDSAPFANALLNRSAPVPSSSSSTFFPKFLNGINRYHVIFCALQAFMIVFLITFWLTFRSMKAQIFATNGGEL